MTEEEKRYLISGSMIPFGMMNKNKTEIILKEKPKFELGQLVMTAGIAQKMEKNAPFRLFISDSMNRYCQCDWGDTCEEDMESNDYALTHGERLLAVYKYLEITIWIITEWDRSATTILFPDEY